MQRRLPIWVGTKWAFLAALFTTNHTDEHPMDAHFCRANLVLKVDKGYYKETKLDGAKVWLATDLGSDWSTGKDSWLVVTSIPTSARSNKPHWPTSLASLSHSLAEKRSSHRRILRANVRKSATASATGVNFEKLI